MCPGSPSTQGWCGMPGEARPGVMGAFPTSPFILHHLQATSGEGASALLLSLHHHRALCCGGVL